MKGLNKKGVASLEIVLLLGMVFAVSFIIWQSDNVSAATISTPSVCCEKLYGNDDNYCVNAPSNSCDTSVDERTGQPYKTSPTSCETTSYCKLGTCYDSSEGICMANTPQRVCQEQGGTWDDREVEEVPQCQLGCCIVSDQAALVPLVRCKKLSSFYGVNMDYRTDITSEIECIAEAQSQDMGACVYEKDFERTCEFTSRSNCGAAEEVETASNGTNITISTDRKFYEDYLCSAEELNTACARQTSTGCFEGDVYWFDSCGNKENVYSGGSDAEKLVSWNNGRIAEANEICGPNNGEEDECGNCDYLLGTRCSGWEGILGVGKWEDSDYFCRRTECVDDEGNDRLNGESWCVYDAHAGEGLDPVGSRYYKKTCVDGEVSVEPCADFRNEVCIEGSMDTEGGEFSTAACRVNRWQTCVAQTNQNACENTDERDCMWLPPISGLTIGGANSGGAGGKTFSNPVVGDSSEETFSNPETTDAPETSGITGQAIFGGGDDEGEEESEETTTNRPGGVCVPDFSPGLKFWEDGDARSICGQASAKCIVKFEESKFGGRECIENCECLEEEWGQAMNSVCVAMGDCGGYVNYNEEWTDDGYEWTIDGAKEKFAPNTINKIKIEASSPGKSSSLAWAVPASLGAVGLIAGTFGGELAKASTLAGTSFIPNLATPAFNAIEGFAGLSGEAATLSGLTTNWLAAGAFNALLIGGIVWAGASMFGEDSNTAGALGAATMAGLMAGTLASKALAGIGESSSWIPKLGTIVPKGSTFSVGGQTFTEGTKLTAEMAKQAGFPGGTFGSGGTLSTSALSTSQIALVNLGVTIGVAILVYYLLKKDYDEEVVEFNCMPWQAPLGGDDCEICNDENLACSEYRCKSLGQSCEIVNAGTEDEKCVDVNPRDVDPPVISPNENELTEGYEYSDVKNSPPGPGFRIVPEDGSECVDAFTPLKFAVNTDEPAQCKIEFNHTGSFEDMRYWMGGTNLFLYNHTEQFNLPGADTDGLILENGKDWTFFIRCQDKKGNANSAEYAVRFCTEEGPDATAPQIKATSIVNGGCVAANTDSANVEFYVNEPADCRWSFNDEDYDNMENEMNCVSEKYQINSLQLYTCAANLTGIARDETNFYVRCEDQPNAEPNDRNENRQSYEFSLRGSTDLKIANLQPNGTIFGAVNPAPVELYVETLFGCDDGKAICYYSRTGRDDDYVMFYDTNNDDGISTQRQDLTSGDYNYFYKCVDSGGNVAIENTEFELEIDTNAPVVARVYEEDQMLKVVTVRKGECVYSTEDCDYSFSEGIEMPYANSTVHVTEWNEEDTYYIKCRDEFRNEEADCSIVVRPTRNFL